MNYEALITLEIPNVKYDNIRTIFYDVLRNNNWDKISKISTTWRRFFNKGETREDAIKALTNDMKTAKTRSGVVLVEYAIQLGYSKVEFGEL